MTSESNCLVCNHEETLCQFSPCQSLSIFETGAEKDTLPYWIYLKEHYDGQIKFLVNGMCFRQRATSIDEHVQSGEVRGFIHLVKMLRLAALPEESKDKSLSAADYTDLGPCDWSFVAPLIKETQEKFAMVIGKESAEKQLYAIKELYATVFPALSKTSKYKKVNELRCQFTWSLLSNQLSWLKQYSQ